MNLDEQAKFLLLLLLAEHVGHQQRIDRASLKEQLGERLGASIGDRKMRDLIEELRFDHPQGAWICGSLSGGYFVAKDEDELNEHLASDENRAHKLLARVRNQRLHAGQQNPAQMRMVMQ